MLKLSGQCINVFKAPDFVQNGVTTPGQFKVQLQCKNIMKNGEMKIELHTLGVSDPSLYEVGETVEVPVSCYCKNNQVVFFGVE